MKTQALSHLAGGMTQMIESLAKRHKALLEFERARDRNFMEFKRAETEKTDNMNCRLLKYSHKQCTIKVFKGHLIPQTPTFIKEKTSKNCASRKKHGPNSSANPYYSSTEC